MTEARRTLGRWLLTAFLERGCGPVWVEVGRPAEGVRPLTAAELAAWTAPLAPVVRLRRRPAAIAPSASRVAAARAARPAHLRDAAAPQAPASAAETPLRPNRSAARLLAFPGR